MSAPDRTRALALIATLVLAIAALSSAWRRRPAPAERPWTHQRGTPVELAGDGLYFVTPGANVAALLAQAHHPCRSGQDRRAGGPSLRPGDRVVVSAQCSARVERMAGAARLTLGLRLDPNRDDADALAALPGVGPVLARAIVEDRARRGPFRELEGMLRVSGIGPSTLRRLSGHVTLRSSVGERHR